MAFNSEDLKIKISVEAKGASKNVEVITESIDELGKVADKTTGSIKNLTKQTAESSSAFSNFQKNVIAINQSLELAQKIYGKFSGAISRVIDAYSVQEKAETELRNALKLTGQFTEQNFRALTQYASALQSVSTIGDELTIGLQKRAIAYGLNIEQTNMLVQASADLAAATGKDVKTAFDQLLKTFGGMAGELGEVLPELKKLTQEQLRAGDAARIIGERFRGLAAQDAKTFNGSVIQMNNAFGDLLEEIGKTIVQLFDLSSSAKSAQSVFVTATASIVSFRTAWQAINWQELEAGITAIGVALSVGIIAATPKIQLAAASLVSLGIASAKFIAIGAGFVGIGAAIEILVRNITNLGGVWDATVSIMQGAWNSFMQLVLSGTRTALMTVADFMDALPQGAQRFIGGANGIAAAIDRIAQAEIELIRAQPALSDGINNAVSEIDTGFTGKAINAVKQFTSALNQTSDVATQASQSIKKTSESAQALSKYATDLDRVSASMRQILLDLAAEELSNVDQVRLSVALERQKLLEIEKQIKAAGAMTNEERTRLDAIREQLDIIEQLKITRAPIVSDQDKQLLDQISKTVEDIEKTRRESGMNQTEIYKMNLRSQLDQLDAVKERLQLEYQSTDNAERQLKIAEQMQKISSQQTVIRQEIEAPSMGGQAGNMADIFGSEISGILGKLFPQLASKFAGIIGSTLASFANIFAIILKAPDLLKMVADFNKQIETWPTRLADALLDVVSSFDKMLTNLPENMGRAVARIIPALIKNVVNDSPRLFGALIDAVLRAIEEVVKQLPQLVMGFFDHLVTFAPRVATGIIRALIRGIPAIVKGLIKAMPQIAKALAVGFIEAVLSLGDVFGEMFSKNAMSKLVDNMGAAVSKLGQNVGEQIFAVADIGAVKSAEDTIMPLIKDAIRQGESLWNQIIAALRKAWEWIKKYIWDPMIQSLQFAWDTIKIVWDTMVNLLQGVWDSMMTLFQGVWDGVTAIWNGMMNVFSGLWDSVELLWNNLVASLQAVWNFVVTLFDDPIAAFKGLWEDIKNIFSSFLNGLGGIWERLRTGFSGIIDGLGKISQAFTDFLKNLGGKFVEAATSLWNRTRELFAGFGSIIANAAGALWDRTKSFFSGIGGVVYESISNALSRAGNFLARIFSFESGGRGTVERFLGFDFPWVAFSEGGVVPGKAKTPGDNRKNDTIPALLSPGEIVIPRSMTKDKAFMAVIEEKFAGRDVPQFALGGTLGKVIRGDFKGAAKDVRSGIVGLTGTVKEVFDFIRSLGASMPSVLDVIKDPVGSLKKAFESVATKFFQPVVLKQLQNIVGRQFFAAGGPVSDTVPAMLTPGEFVMRREAVSQIGLDTLQAMNRGTQPIGTTNQTITVNLTLNANERIDAAYVRDKLMPAIKDELRKESRRGGYIIAAAGVRA